MKSIVSVFIAVLFCAGTSQAIESLSREPRPVFPRMMDWARAWEEGLKTEEASIAGAWKLIGRATSENCSYHGRDAFDVRGMRGYDGGHPVLEFSNIELPGYARELFIVKLNSMGGRVDDQGPYEASGKEPQLSLWGYESDGKLSSNRYMEYSCRLHAKNEKWMICLMSMKLKRTSVADEKSLACASDKHGMAYIFSR